MASKKILVQLDIQAASSLTSPLSGFVGFSAKADGLYQKIGTAPELRLLTSADVQNAILADGSITGAVSQAQIFTMGVKLYNLTQGYVPYASGATKLLSNSPIYTDGTNVGIGTTSPSKMLSIGSGNPFTVTSAGVLTAPNGSVIGTATFNSTGTNLGSVLTVGNDIRATYGIHGGSMGTGMSAMGTKAWNDTMIGFAVRANSATQSADLLQAQNSSGAVLAGITASGGGYYSGNVGIGIVLPDDKLHVIGDAHITGNTYSSKIIVNPTSGVGWYRIASSGQGGGGTVYLSANIDNTNQRLEFTYNIRGWIDSSSMVGSVTVTRSMNYNSGPVNSIRISSDGLGSSYLDLYVSTANAPVPFTVYGTNGASFLASPEYNPVVPTYTKVLDLNVTKYWGIQTTDSINVGENATISGNVGIGTNNLIAPLTIQKQTGGTGIVNAFVWQWSNSNLRARLAYNGWDPFLELFDAASVSKVKISSYGDSYFNATGNVGIGTTDPGAYKLNVNGNTNITGNLNLSSLTASKLVFTDSSKNLTSIGIGTASQFIKGDGSLDSNTYLTTGTAIISGSGVDGRITFWSGTNSLSSSAYLTWDDTNSRLSVNSISLASSFKLGASSTAGYVLTTDANGNGTWQAPQGGGNIVSSVFGRTGTVVAVNGDYNTSQVTENTNLYFTDSRARVAISLTINGQSGASTYNNSTGILNVPNYSLTGLGGVPKTRTITINGEVQDLSANRTWNVGDLLSTGSYSNPSWLTSLAWSKITNKPTTFYGYGITETPWTSYLPLSGGTLTGDLNSKRIICQSIIGDDYNTGAIEILGSYDNTFYPTLGFHQPSNFAASIQLRGAIDFRLYAQGGTTYANLTTNKLISASLQIGTSTTSGYVLTADANGNGTWQAPTGSLSGFVPYTGANDNVNLGTHNLSCNEITTASRLTVGNTDIRSYTDGGYLSAIAPSDSYAKLSFYSKDTLDGLGVVQITANPEEGIILRARSNDNSSDSYLEVRHWELGFYTNLQKRLEIAQSGSINAFGNTITSTGGFIGNASTATKLQTARTITIGNQSLSFDGTQNLTYSLSGIGIPVGTASQYIRGDLSLATFPTIISGSGATGYITLWDGTKSQTYDTNLIFDSVNNILFTQSIQLVYNFKLGSSTTAGYVLTTDAYGNGTWQAPTGGSYTLPTASASVLGCVKIGSGITISSGVISVSTNYEAPLTFTNGLSRTGNTVSFSGSSSYVPYTGANGNVDVGSYVMYANNFILNSDINLKCNIESIEIKNIDIDYKKYEFKSLVGDIRYGVIAQELLKVAPELVSSTPNNTFSVKYIDLLIHEIAYLKQEIKKLTGGN